MTSNEAAILIKEGLNKLDSKSYPDIELWQIEAATNRALLAILRRKLPKKEERLKDVEDLQILLKSAKLSGSNKNIYFLSHKFPDDYFWYSRSSAIVSKGNCKNVRMHSSLQEDANIDNLLSDYASSPSFDFEQTFHVISGNKIYQYHNNDFIVEELELFYYRIPQRITYEGTFQWDGSTGKDKKWEWSNHFSELIIEETINNLAGNIENNNMYQISAHKLQQLN